MKNSSPYRISPANAFTFGLEVQDLMPISNREIKTCQSSFRLPYHIRPKQSISHQHRAEQLYAAQQHYPAQEEAREALICHPANAQARKSLAYSLQALGQSEEALMQYRMALGLENNQKRALIHRNATHFVNKKGFGVLNMINRNTALRKALVANPSEEKNLARQLNGLQSLKPMNAGKPMSKVLRVAVSILLLIFFSPLLQAQNNENTISIQGRVSNHPHQMHPITQVIAKDPETQQELGTSQTDAEGFYSLQITSTGTSTQDLFLQKQDFYLAPNPFGQHTTLHARLPHPGTYTLQVHDKLGRLILQQSIQAHAGDNAIPISLDAAPGFVAISLQNTAYLKTTKAFNMLHLHSTALYNTTLNNSLTSEVQNITLSDNTTVYASDNQQHSNIVGHDRLKSNDAQNITLRFDSQGHEQRDTLLTWQNHSNIDMTLQVTPEHFFANYALTATNNPMNQNVHQGHVNVTNEHGDVLINEQLTNGNMQTTFPQTEWIHEGDTIRHTNQLISNITAEHHHAQELFNMYNKNTTITTVLEQIKQQQTANTQINATNNVMNAPVQGLVIEAYTNNNELIGVFNQNNFEITRGFYANGTDTLPDFESVKFVLKAPSHQDSDTITKPYTQNMTINHILEQTPHNHEAELNMNFTSTPLLYAPTLNATILNNNNEITQTTTPNGEATITIPYTAYINGEDTLKLINNEPIENIHILAQNEKHQQQEYTIQFQPQMNLDAQIAQTPQQRTSTITTNLTGNIFGEAPNNVNIQYKNNENQQELLQGQTTNGQHTAQITYNYWEHEDLEHQDLNEIKQTITKNGVYEEIEQILSNQDQTLELTLTQIPQEKTAQIIGNIKNTTQEPLQDANVEIKHENTTYTTTTTQTNGDFQTTIPYTEYTNPENQNQRITIPENIHAKITKPTYQTHTTETQTLENLIDFGTIQLTPEPIIKTLNFTFKPITVDGDPQTPNNIINVRLGNVTQTYTVGAQNEINVNITAETNDSHVTIWDEPPVNANNEPIYNDVIILHKQNREWHEPPIKNNNQTALRTTASQPFDTLRVDYEAIHNRHDLELIKMYNSFDHPDPTIGTLYTNKLRAAHFITGRAGYHIWSHTPTAEGDGWQILFKTYDEAVPENNVSQTFIDNWTNAINQVMNASTRNDGQKTFDWGEIYFVSSPDDPVLLAAQENNWLNTLRIEPNSSTSMATNIVSTGQPNHVYGRARTPPAQTSVSVALEETLEPTYRFTDPDQSSVNYIIKWVDGAQQLNNFAKRAIRYRQQLSHGTRFDHVVDD